MTTNSSKTSGISMILIDSRVTDYKTLIDHLANAGEVFIIDAESDGVAQIAAKLQGRSDIDALHIISHGSQGALYLGSTVMRSDNLSTYALQLGNIGSALTQSGDVLLYGCDVAQGASGQQFIQTLSTLIFADVAASTNASGPVAQGGDSDLEIKVGLIERSGLDLTSLSTLLGLNTTPTFAIRDGIVTTAIKDFIAFDVVEQSHVGDIKAQADGKILVTGGGFFPVSSPGSVFLTLLRYDSDGSLDTSFRIQGVPYAYESSNIGGVGQSIIIQPDGKILVAGNTKTMFFLARYHIDGSLDLNFGANGVQYVKFGVRYDTGAVECATLQSDGKILVVGNRFNYDFQHYDFALVRHNINGSLDTSFSGDGQVSTNVGTELNVNVFGIGSDYGQTVNVQADGRILVAGTSRNSLALVRYNSNGSLDTSFSNDGKLIADQSLRSIPRVAFQADGKILVAGSSFSQNSPLTMIRYNNDGSLDSSFIYDRQVVTILDNNFRVSGITVQADGKILVAGTETNYSNYTYNITLLRFNIDGTLDSGFDGDGKVTTSIISDYEVRITVAVQTDGTILVGGSSRTGESLRIEGSTYPASQIALLRLNSDGSIDNTFGTLIGSSLDGLSNYVENGGAIVLDDNVQIIDPELSASNNYSGSKLTLTRQGGASFEDFFSGAGIVAGDASGNIIVSSIVIGNYIYNSGILTLTFNSSATKSLVNQAIQSIAYENSSDAPPASVQINWTFNDGNTGLQGIGGALNVTGSSSVNITGVNDAPTGAVTITGTSTQGVVLTAANTLADVDGLGTISYQWLAADVIITGATTSTLTLAQAQVGKAITVKASYTDGYGAAESVTSSATASVANINDAHTGSVTITGTATQGQVLTVANTLADVDGLGTLSYQWAAVGVDITGATGSTLTLTQAQVDKVITVRASYTDGQGTAESVASSATSSVANVNDVPTGSVTISGTTTQGQTLKASNTLADIDGIPTSGDGAIKYQWNAGGTAINGATASIYILTQAEVGKAITVMANYTDGQGTSESKTSLASVAVTNVNDELTGHVTLIGTFAQGRTLSAANTLADEDGISAISYQWSSDGMNIAGATSSRLTLEQEQVGKLIRVVANCIDDYGNVQSVSSSPSAAVLNINDARGIVTIGFASSNDFARSMALQSDGKILLAGRSNSFYSDNSSSRDDFALVRFNTNGSLDSSFSGDGMLTTDIGSSDNQANSVKLQADGKILLAGSNFNLNYNGSDFALVRYSSDGSLDTSFGGGDGILTTEIQKIDYANSMSLQSDGKILLAGYSFNITGGEDFALVRYNSDGSLDGSFSEDGMLTTDFGASSDEATSIAIQANGKILLAGKSRNSSGNSDFALVRYNIDGSLDSSFSGDGIVTTAIGSSDDIAQSLVVQADGKILLAGYIWGRSGGDTEFALMRYNSDGSLDSSFSGDGMLTSDLMQFATSISIQADGKILLAGRNYSSTNGYNFALMRYNSDGSLDSSFSDDGMLTTSFGASSNAGASTVALQADGKILLAGDFYYSYIYSTDRDFALVRYNSDGSLDSSFGANNIPTGAVTISGAAIEGQTLTAANTMVDTDGLGVIGYQWMANGVNIAGATSATLTLAQAQVGKAITVMANYTDLQGTAESVTSSATAAVTDNVIPTASTFSPADEATTVAVGANVVMTFSEAVLRGAGSIVLKKADGTTVATYAQSSTEVTVSGSTLTINPVSDLSFSTGYKVEFSAGSVKDLSGNNYAGTTSYNFTTGAAPDTTAPTITTFSPADGATGVGVASNITLTLSEPVVARSGGTIELMTDYGFGHQSVEVFSVSDATRVTINGNVVTIDPISALLPSTGYHLGFNNALSDNAGNAFSYTHGQYNFTTGAVTDTTVPSIKFWKNNAPTPSENNKAGAVNLTDAIGILKMIVGLSVNANAAPLSPYQAVAADFDQSGAVDLTDAIGVLKMVVGLSAPAPTWKYFDDTKLASAYNATQPLNHKTWSAGAAMDASFTADSTVKLVGVLTGDVDGSWAG